MRAWWLVALLLAAPLAGCIGGLDDGETTIEPNAQASAGGFSSTHVFEGDYVTDDAFSWPLEDGLHDLLPGESVYLTSQADGVDIQVATVRPDVPEGQAVPVIALASPYLVPLQATGLHDLRDRLTDVFVPQGYAVAFIAVRGTADAGGCIELFGENERADLDQAVTWLGEQPWSNGNVGMVGVSYDGSTPWMVAATGNPHLKTIVPISGLSDVFQLEYRNGTVEQRMLGLISASYYTSGFVNNNPTNGRSPQHVAEGVVCPDTVEGVSASLTSAVTGERDPLGYWAERNQRPLVEEAYNGSIFLVHGLQDWNVDPHHAYPWVNDLEDQGLVVKHLLGQWGHAWPDGDYLEDEVRRYDFNEILLRWFDHELKEDPTVDVGPRAQIQDNTGQWRSADTWPPRDTQAGTLHLTPEGGLSWEQADATGSQPIGADGSIVLGQPYQDMGLCSLCATFTGQPLEEDLRFAGTPRVHVTVTPSTPGGTVAAFLYQVTDEGRERLGWTQMDLRFHDGGETATTVVPGQPILAKLQLEPLDVHVPAGAQLELVLTAGSQHDRLNVGMGAPAMVELGDGQSTLALDTFEVAPDQLFTPPS